MGIVTIENRYVPKIVLTRSYLSRPPPRSPCLLSGDVYGSRSVQKVYKTGYQSESRPKPASLLQNQTGRGVVIRRIEHASVYYIDRLGSGSYSNCLQRDYSYGLPTVPSGAPPTTGWELRARSDVLSTSVNLAQSVFEYRQTASLFSDAAKMVDNIWQEYRRLKKFRRKVTVKNVAEAKLTASFGVVPLLGDLGASLEVLNRNLDGQVHLRRISGLATGKSVMKDAQIGGGASRANGTWNRSQAWSIYVAYDASPYRIIMGNPASLAWELIPWSWLIDGLVDVGSYLASLDALQGVRWMEGSVTTKDRISVSHDYKGSSLFTLVQNGRMIEERYSRSVVNTIPVPPRPRWVASSTYSKVVNATAALIQQRMTPEYHHYDWRKASKLTKDQRREIRRFWYHFKKVVS